MSVCISRRHLRLQQYSTTAFNSATPTIISTISSVEKSSGLSSTGSWMPTLETNSRVLSHDKGALSKLAQMALKTETGSIWPRYVLLLMMSDG